MSIINTRTQNMRDMNPGFDRWENRVSQYGAMDLFKVQTDAPNGILRPSLKEKAMDSIHSTLQVPVYDQKTVTIGSTRSVTIADDENTSQLVTMTFATYSFGFTIVPSLFRNNEFDIQADFNQKMTSAIRALGTSLDNAALSALSTNKSQVFGDELIYTITGNKIIASNAQKDEIIGDLDPIMNSNDYYGEFSIVGNMGTKSQVRKLAEKATYNDSNKTIQYLDKNFHWTNRLANGVGNKAEGYVVNANSVGMLFRVERESLMMTESATGHQWGITNLPLLGIPCGTYYYESVGDYNAVAGAASADMTRAWKQHYGFAVDVAFVTAYNSDLSTRASPIAAFAITTA